MQPTRDRSKVRSLHGLRGVMAWWVVLGHISLGLGWHLPLVDQNTLAVDVFILLSGFVIALLVERKAEPYLAYIVRRAFRLFPLYLPVLAISAALLPIQLVAWHSLSPTRSNVGRIALAQEALARFPLHFSIHIPLLQGLAPRQFGAAAYTIVGQAWSISLEWQFYLIAPFLISAFANRRWLIAAIIMVPLLALAPFFTGAFLGAKILLFAVGILTHLALKREMWWRASIAAVVCAIAEIAKDGALEIIPLGIWLIVIASSIAPAHSRAHLPVRMLGSKLPFHMGEVSYSIYLLHTIPLYGSVYACAVFHITGSASHAAITLATLLLTYVGAIFAYRLLETPGIMLGARLTRIGQSV